MRVFLNCRILIGLTLAFNIDVVHPVLAADRQDVSGEVCMEPQRPLDDQNDVLWQGFLSEIEQFRECVNRRVHWHKAQAKQHSAQAREVADLWNQFVKNKLNAPEDFPHPDHLPDS